MRRTIDPLGPYALTASIGFLEGFVPAAYERPSTPAHLHLAFPVDGRDAVAAVCATQPDGPDRTVHLESVVVAPDGGPLDDAEERAAEDAAIDQLIRILSLDTDGSGYEAVGQRDAAVGRMQAAYPGLRPVLFHSPYEAAAWAIIGTRISIRQGARIKAAMARELGTNVGIHGDTLCAFPTPARLARLDAFRGLFGRKVEYLRGIGEAALDGRLAIDALRAMTETDALVALQRLAGIGPFGAELILLRGMGTTDRAPEQETRLVRAVAQAYDRPVPNDGELGEISEHWRPFRTWVTLLLRTALEETTHEIRDGGRGAGGRPDSGRGRVAG